MPYNNQIASFNFMMLQVYSFYVSLLGEVTKIKIYIKFSVFSFARELGSFK